MYEMVIFKVLIIHKNGRPSDKQFFCTREQLDKGRGNKGEKIALKHNSVSAGAQKSIAFGSWARKSTVSLAETIFLPSRQGEMVAFC